MPGDMPYYLEKGPYLTQIEKFCSIQANAREALIDLRAKGTPIPDLGNVMSNAENANPNGDPAKLRKHLYCDWFGYKAGSDLGPPFTPQDPFDALLNPTTGYWQMYYGDVEGIVRATLIRALEVSLGTDHASPGTAVSPKRHWPIEFWWKCGQGWWEGWVTWRNNQPESAAPNASAGQVTVVFATPGTGHQVLEDPTLGRKLPHFAKDPVNTRVPGPGERFQGSWVVTHNKQQRRRMLTIEGAVRGLILLPVWGTGYVGTNAIVAVQPSWADGGTEN